MKTIRWIALLLAFAPVCLKAEASHSPKIIAVIGQVSVVADSGTSAGTEGTIVPVGATITTASNGQATLQFFDGVVVIVQPDTVVKVQACSFSADNKENTVLDLRSGGVIASLDPAKKDVSHFQVITPTGVATAHGTILAVRVTQNGGTTVATMSGTVTFLTDQGEITISFGQISVDGQVMSVADAVKANPNLAGEILTATASVAEAIGNGSIVNSEQTPNLITSVLAALVDIAVQAAPDRAAEIVRDMIAAASPALQGPDGARTVEAIAQAAALAAARAGFADDAGIADAAKEAADAAEIPGVSPDLLSSSPTDDFNPILPTIDQTQAIVSPSSS